MRRPSENELDMDSIALNSNQSNSYSASDLKELKARRQRYIELYTSLGFSFIPVKSDKTPYVSWIPYQSRHPTASEIENWNAKYPDFNLAIILGAVSNLCAFDFDALIDFEKFSNDRITGKYINSLLTETKRGFHLIYICEKNYTYKRIDTGNFKVEFASGGRYIVEPYAVINDFEYKWVNPPKMLKPLPSELIDLFKLTEKTNENTDLAGAIINTDPVTYPENSKQFYIEKPTLIIEPEKTIEKQKEPQKVKWKYIGKAACIKQILDRELVEGERDNALYTLDQLLLREGNSKEYAKEIVLRKNNLLKNPLPEKEALAIVNEKAYTKLGCKFVTDTLPWIQCENCKYRKEALVKAKEVFEDKDLSDIDKQVFFKLKIIENNNKSKIAKELGKDRREVYRSIERLQKKHYL